MIRVFQQRFHRALTLSGGAWLLFGFAAPLQAAEGTIAARLGALQAELSQCGLNEATCPPAAHRTWLTLRWSGKTLLLRRRGASESGESESASQKELIQRLGRASVAAPAAPGLFRAWTLSVRDGWSRPRVALEKSLSDQESVLLVTELSAEWGTQIHSGDQPLTARDWVFSDSGETLYQTEGLFIGSDFGGNQHFNNPQSRTSFDQREVRPRWESLGHFGWRVLHEELQPETMPVFTERAWKWLSEWGLLLIQLLILSLMVVFGGVVRISYALLKRIRVRGSRTKGDEPAEDPSRLAGVASPVQVQVPRVIEAQREVQRIVSPPTPSWNWNESILRARSFLELGRRLMVSIAEKSGSPVVFLEFHREASLAIYRDQVGLRPEEAPLSLRIPLSDLPGHLVDQPAFQSFILNRLGVSHFETYELRSSGSDALRSYLLGVFVILQPGVTSYEARPDLEKLLTQAGKYYDAFLRPKPPQIRT